MNAPEFNVLQAAVAVTVVCSMRGDITGADGS
jgi:hypothetical protein